MVTMQVEARVAPTRLPDRWTHEELDALPDDGMRYELLDGILLVSPSPVTAHQRVVTRLLILLDAACPPGFETFVAPFDWRPDDLTSLEPDVLVVPQTALTKKNVTGTPAIVVEVLSPGTRRIDRTAKLSRYEDGAIPQYWIVDPGDPADPASPAVVEVYELAAAGYRLAVQARGDEQVTITGPVEVTLRPVDLVRPR